MAIVFPKSQIVRFYAHRKGTKQGMEEAKHLRLGQHFHNWAELHKVVNPEDKAFCDRLYNADDNRAGRMLVYAMDWSK